MRTGLAVVLTALVTAVLTSAVWLLIFNLRVANEAPSQPRRPVPAQPAAVPSVQTPAPPPASTPASGDLAALAAKRLTIPVAGIEAAMLRDTFGEDRDGGARPHEALDILAPRGTPVVATEDGQVAKLFTSKPGGLTIYEFDPSGRYAYYYAHLDRYADGLGEAQAIKRGQVIGYVGSTGNASPDAPHLHFAIFRLGPEKRWYEGTPVNPYRPLGGNQPAPQIVAGAN